MVLKHGSKSNLKEKYKERDHFLQLCDDRKVLDESSIAEREIEPKDTKM